MKKLALLGVPLVILVLLAAVAMNGWVGSGPAEKNVPVLIPEGSSLTSAAATLERAHVLASADRFLLLARIFGGNDPIQAGEYEIPAGASPAEILALLQNGKTLQRFIMIP